MCKYLVFNVSKYKNGGAEKNAYQLINHFANKKNYKVIILGDNNTPAFLQGSSEIVFTKKIFTTVIVLALQQIIKKNITFFSLKGNLALCVFFYLIGSKIVIRVNNSFEAYMYWAKASSIISFVSRIIMTRRCLFVFNSRYNLYFFSNIRRTTPVNTLYLPNTSWTTHVARANTKGEHRYIIRSRLASEKNVVDTIGLLIKAGVTTKEIFVYGSGSEEARLIKKYPSISIFRYDEYTPYENDILVTGAMFEGMPNAVIESLAAGIKCVLAANWAHVELADLCQKHQVSWISTYQPYSVTSLQVAINKVKASEVSYHALGDLYEAESKYQRAALNLMDDFIGF